jgi:hypothetical protein
MVKDSRRKFLQLAGTAFGVGIVGTKNFLKSSPNFCGSILEANVED